MAKQNRGVAASAALDVVSKAYVDQMDDAHIGIGPAAHGALAWTCDPAMTANATPAVGRLHAVRFRAHTTGTVTSIMMHVSTAGASLTQVWAAIFDTNGNRISLSTANQNTAFQSTGAKTIPMSAVNIVAGTDYVFVFLQAGSTGAAVTGTIGSTNPNLGVVASASNPMRQSVGNSTGLTAIPTTATWTAFTAVGNGACALMDP